MLKRLCNVAPSDKVILWAVRCFYGSTEALKSVCQLCGKHHFGILDVDQSDIMDAFCDACWGSDLKEVFVEVGQETRIEVLHSIASKRSSKRGKIKGVEAILKRDNYSCKYCDYSPMATPGVGISIGVDHIIPYSYGGSDDNSNLVASCSKCNGIAGSNIFKDFYSKREFIIKRRIDKKLPVGDKQWDEYVRNPFRP